tara:strand:+ start:433 stop:621 length:189 start_codon:yes stop_codon:yes gene_type:complete
MIINRDIKNCKYFRTPDSTKDECIIATIDGVECFVPIDEANTDYAEIKRKVDAGELTIEDAD